jgi:hypothetical protein
MSLESRTIFEMDQPNLSLIPTRPGHDVSKRKCSCPPHSPPNAARKKHASLSDEVTVDNKPKPKKKKKKKRKGDAKLDEISSRQVTKVEPLESPKSAAVDLSERFTALPRHTERRILSPLTNDMSSVSTRSIRQPTEKVRHVLIPPIDLAQAQTNSTRRNSDSNEDQPVRRRREGRRRRRHSFSSDCSSDAGGDVGVDPFAIEPFEDRDSAAIIPVSDDDDESSEADSENEEREDKQSPCVSSPRLTITVSPPHLTMPIIDEAVRHSGAPVADAESDAAYYRRALQARRAVEGTSAERNTYFEEQETANTNYFDECSSPLPKIIVGSFGFAEEGDSHFLKMDVWDTMPVRCNSR